MVDKHSLNISPERVDELISLFSVLSRKSQAAEIKADCNDVISILALYQLGLFDSDNLKKRPSTDEIISYLERTRIPEPNEFFSLSDVDFAYEYGILKATQAMDASRSTHLSQSEWKAATSEITSQCIHTSDPLKMILNIPENI